MLNFGQHPRLGVEPIRKTSVEAVEDFIQRMKASREEAKAALQQAADDMAKFYDLHREAAPSYKVGDMVWLDGKDLTTDRPSKKPEDKRYGPYKITHQISPSAYKLKLPTSMKIHPVFGVSKLIPYEEDPIPGRKSQAPPPPVIAGENPEWEVEFIKDSRLYRGKLQFLVKWKGYPHEESTWEPEKNLAKAPKALQDFYTKHPMAPRRISAMTYSRLPFQPYENFTVIPPSMPLFDWTKGKHIEGNVP
jgi:hypothetical protein